MARLPHQGLRLSRAPYLRWTQSPRAARTTDINVFFQPQSFSPESDFLGEEQWAWLGRTLNESRSDVNIIVSGIQVLPTLRFQVACPYPARDAEAFAVFVWAPSQAFSSDFHLDSPTMCPLPPSTRPAQNHNNNQPANRARFTAHPRPLFDAGANPGSHLHSLCSSLLAPKTFSTLIPATCPFPFLTGRELGSIPAGPEAAVRNHHGRPKSQWALDPQWRRSLCRAFHGRVLKEGGSIQRGKEGNIYAIYCISRAQFACCLVSDTTQLRPCKPFSSCFGAARGQKPTHPAPNSKGRSLHEIPRGGIATRPLGLEMDSSTADT